jgi:hypothetical protein
MELLRHPGKPRRATPGACEATSQTRISQVLNPGYSLLASRCGSFERFQTPFRADQPDGPWGVEAIVRALAQLPINLDEEHGPYLCPRCKAESLMLRDGCIYD